ncbi:MAG TPA: hypothetical protein VHN59_11685 [Chitinophagaceae bacterium]|nr:hypothetical protein [Chitinophagaceae bacterium]
MARLVIYFCLIFSTACKNTSSSSKAYDLEMCIRSGGKYHSIYMDKSGNSVVEKGKGTFYDEDLKKETVEESKTFKVESDSVRSFISNLEKLKRDPIKTSKRLDASRVEIYLEGQKIYDSYSWDSSFWDMIRPIIRQIPKQFNPFMS